MHALLRSLVLGRLAPAFLPSGLALGLLLGLLSGPVPGQDSGGGAKPPPAPPPLPGKPAAADPRIAALRPGVLPEGASEPARAAWERICRASLPTSSEPAPVTSFALELDVRYRGGPGRTNDVHAVYKFLAPAFVRVEVEGKRDALRGPKGDYLVDRTRKETVPLSVAREHAEDRRQLDETVGIAKTFVALTDPRSLRIASLETLPGPPASIPAPLAKRAGELAWLRISSPDFRLIGSGASARLFRASLGSDPRTGWVEMALVEEDVQSPALRPSARLVQLLSPKPTQGFQRPEQILVHSLEEGISPPRFAVPAGMDLWIKRADLRAPLKPEDFQP